MKIKLLLLILGLSFITATAQFGPQQIISSNTDRAYLSIPMDIDNDGYIDVLKSSLEDYKLQWHRNLDGEGNFGPEILITDNPALYLNIDFVDLDSDGDNDLLYRVNNPRIVGWFENLDGLGDFGPEQIILENQPDFISAINAKDIDNDDDIDLIVKFATGFIDRIVWYENLSGSGTFSDEILLIDNVTLIHPPVLVDIDNDGNLDILTSHENIGPANLIWYKNLGNVIFGPEQEIHQFGYFQSDWTHVTDILYADINTDEKKDIVVSTSNEDFGNLYHWFENIDNLGNFGPIQYLPISGDFVDIDNDGDNDILTGNRFADRIYWIENSDGLGTFTTERTITTEVDFLKDIKAADLNGDGLLDVLSASLGDDKIAWYENTGILGFSENTHQNVVIYPNPTNGKVHIKSTTKISVVEIYNCLGEQIKTCFDCQEINLSMFPTGIYIFKITDELGNSEIHKVIKE